jgi:hypothetical protein
MPAFVANDLARRLDADGHPDDLVFTAPKGDPLRGKHSGDGFFVAFDRADQGVACAVDIQRRLAAHRREHGFAPWVPIGRHGTEATQRTG